MPRPPLARILRASSIRTRAFKATGVPAILLGAAAIVGAAGVSRALAAAAPSLGAALHEATNLVLAIRGQGERRRLSG
ncbi:MAG TPA: hypothetical protein VFB22_17570 [Candidatus Baltobacteraceae bacterium]|nr:hypothetical protein [Candidatus Baltobacteraceae bacterium]